MAGIMLKLLGSASNALAPGGNGAQEIRSSKGLALLAYLALEPGAHSRDELATLLWGESGDAAARASLRQALKLLRAVVGDGLRADRDWVELVAGVECDVHAFLAACDQQPAVAAMFDVAQFMHGVVVPHAPAFEEWVDRTRAALRRRHLEALRKAVREAMAASRWHDAVTFGTRWIGHEPLSDEAVRFVAESEFMAGNHGAALARVRAHVDRAHAEENAKPSAALVALKRRLEAEVEERPRSGHLLPRATPPFAPTLIGREGQWRVLSDVWRGVSEGEGRVVLVEGEVGMGKTRLAEDWLRWVRSQGGTVLRGRAHDAESAIPYGPLTEALRCALDAPGIAGTAPGSLAEITRLLPELRQTFRDLPALAAATDAAERARLFEAVAQLLLALAEEEPVVLLIDDLQWCDGDTCALVHFLMQRLAANPVALVLTVRLGDLDRDAPAARLFRALHARAESSVIQMTSLNEDEVRQIVRESNTLQNEDRVTRLAAGLHHATDGNPFHVVELLKTLVKQGAIGIDADTGEWFAARFSADAGDDEADDALLPPAVRDAVAARVARLPYELRDLLATVAVCGAACGAACGAVCGPALLAQAHGMSRLRASVLCDELVARLLLREDDGLYSCAHPVIAGVVRGTLSTSRRAETHRAIAMALEAITPDEETGPLAAKIARHAHQGRERAMSYYYALLATDDAVRRAALSDAQWWLDFAAQHADPGEQMDDVKRRSDALRRDAATPD